MTDFNAEALRELLRRLPVFAGDLPDFDSVKAPEAPAPLFVRWLRDAIESGVAEPHTVTLSTVDSGGRANSRVLLLKGVNGNAWQIATSATSVKGRELLANASAALAAYWPILGRQVRVRGTATAATKAASAADFLARSVSARAEALLGRQSDVLDDPDTARAAHANAIAKIASVPTVVAPHWTVYEINADAVEFLQARPDRWHTRLRYRRIGDRWIKEALWP
jgi:pyridoxamine 5'-phosphate oxidase